MTLKTTILNILTGATLAVTLTATAVQAETELRWASSAPAGTPWAKHAEAFAEAFGTATDGAYTVSVFNGSQLGKEVDVLKQIARGRVAMGAISTPGMATQIPEVSLLSAPYLFNNYEEVDCVYDTHLTDILTPMFEARNFKILQWNELGFANMFGIREIITPDQLKAMKVRVNVSPAAKNFYDALGINGIYIPYAETPSALQTGLIEAGSLQTVLFVAGGLGKVAPYLTLTEHSHDSGMIVMNLKLWNSLSEEEQKKLMEALPAQDGLRSGVRGMDTFLLDKFAEAGGTVTRLDDAQLAVWKEMGTSRYAELVADIGGEAPAVWEKLNAAIQECRE